MSAILITGGAGFIGSSLADKLIEQGKEVIVIDNFNDYYDVSLKKSNIKNNLSNPKYRLYQADIEDKQVLGKIFSENKISAVVHLAARAGVRPSLENPLAYIKTNILGTVNILEEMKEHHIKKLVFASSSSVYGNCRAEKFSEELNVREPISPYAATKSSCEQICHTYMHLYGINTICLRFFTVYGPRQRPDLAINKFTHLIDVEQSIPMYGNGNTCRDYTYIDDIVDGICSAIEYNKTSYEIINLGGGEPITLKNMIETIEKTLNKKAIIDHLPMQPGDVDKTICDWSKAKALLNYIPKTSFVEGISKFINWLNNTKKI